LSGPRPLELYDVVVVPPGVVAVVPSHAVSGVGVAAAAGGRVAGVVTAAVFPLPLASL
jgi:hypothetical protein